MRDLIPPGLRTNLYRSLTAFGFQKIKFSQPALVGVDYWYYWTLIKCSFAEGRSLRQSEHRMLGTSQPPTPLPYSELPQKVPAALPIGNQHCPRHSHTTLIRYPLKQTHLPRPYSSSHLLYSRMDYSEPVSNSDLTLFCHIASLLTSHNMIRPPELRIVDPHKGFSLITKIQFPENKLFIFPMSTTENRFKEKELARAVFDFMNTRLQGTMIMAVLTFTFHLRTTLRKQGIMSYKNSLLSSFQQEAPQELSLRAHVVFRKVEICEQAGSLLRLTTQVDLEWRLLADEWSVMHPGFGKVLDTNDRFGRWWSMIRIVPLISVVGARILAKLQRVGGRSFAGWAVPRSGSLRISHDPQTYPFYLSSPSPVAGFRVAPGPSLPILHSIMP